MARSPRRRRRWAALIGLAALLVVGASFAYLRVQWEGSDLGSNIARLLNKRMRGRISIGSVEWATSSLERVVRGGWAPVTIRNVRVWDDCALSSDLAPLDERRLGDPSEDCTPDDRPDPDPRSRRKPRKLLIDAPLITAEIDVHAALFGNHDLVFRNATVHGGELLLEQTSEPYPLHAYDRTIVSVLTAFYPRMKPGFRAGIYASAPPPKFELRDIHIKDLDLTLQFAPYAAGSGKVGYGLAARIEDVNIDPTPLPGGEPSSYLHMNATDPLVAKFYVRLALTGKHSRLRIRDEGPRDAFVIPRTRPLGDEWGKGRSASYELELSDIAINRLAQLPDQWGKQDYVANSLELDITAHTIPCTLAGVPGDVRAGADLHLLGELRDWWDRPYDGEWNLDLEVANAGPTVRSCINPSVGGDNLHGQLRLRGPFIASPRIEVDLHGLDLDVPLSSREEPIRLTLAEVDGYLDLVNEQGSINRTTALIRGGKEPGEVMLSARFGLRPLNSVADLDITKPVDIGRFLPPRVASSIGRYVAGKLTVGGDVEEGFELKNFDVGLGRTADARDRALRVYKGRIFAKNSFEWISIERVRLEAGRNWAEFNGGIQYVDGVLTYKDLTIDYEFPGLGQWLQQFGLPDFAQSAGGGRIVLNGPVNNPTMTLRTELAGIPCIDTLSIPYAKVQDGLVEARLSTAGLGGNLEGTLRADLQGALPAITRLELTGTRIEASKLCGLGGSVKGTLDTVRVALTRRTTIDKDRAVVDWLSAVTVQLAAPRLDVLGETYRQVAVALNHELRGLPAWLERRLDGDDAARCGEAVPRGGFCGVVEATRERGGKLGAVVSGLPASGSGRAPGLRRLGGTLALDDIPLAVLDPWIGSGKAGGLVSATLHLGGLVTAPSVELGSTVNLTRAWFGTTHIGDAQLGIMPTTFNKADAIRLYGTVMTGQLGIDAIVGTAKPHAVELAISGRRVELDHFVDLSKRLGFAEPVQAWASGTITARTELAPVQGRPAPEEAWVELTELDAIVNHRSRDGRLRPLRFAMVPRANGQFALSARVTPSALDLTCRDYASPTGRSPCPALLRTPAGTITLAGGATAAQMQLRAEGELDLSRLAPLLEAQLEDIDGVLRLEGQLTGTLSEPHYEVALDVKNLVSVRLPGGDAVLQVLGPRVVAGERVPGAQLKIANGVVGFNSFVVNVNDERKDERGELAVSGGIALSGLTPSGWGLLVEGKIAGKMLAALAPGAISQASGLARIEAALGGRQALPLVNATLSFDPEEGARVQPLEISPRGVRRALAFTGGAVEIRTRETAGGHRTYALEFRDSPLTVTIDNEGKLTNIRGQLALRDGVIERASVGLDAEGIPYRVPGEFELLMSARDLRLDLPGSSAPWQARGSIAVVNGTYKRNFVLTEAIRPAPDTAAPAKPFWDEYPSIGNADLDLTVEVRRFAVENNLGPPSAPAIELTGPRLLLTGSPRDPRLAGTVRVQRGEFRLPATRARFTRTTGSIDFAENQKASNPNLEITSDADYFDLSGQAHTITMTITGSLEQPLWDLRTSTGYNKSQTLALLFLGRNPEQLSRTLGDQSLGANPTNVDPSTNPTTGFADQIVRDLAGDWVSSLFGSSLSRFTRVDVLRFELGFGAVGIHAEKLVGNARFIGDAEQTTRGYTLNARLEIKTPPSFRVPHPWRRFSRDRVTLQGAYLDKSFNDPAELDVRDLQGKVVYRLFIP